MTSVSLPAQELAGYRLVKELGQGGMGMVYLAIQPGLERQVALKVLLPELQKNQDFVTRFMREGRAAARFSHPNVVTVYDASIDEKGVPFIAFEYLAGGSVEQLIRTRGKLPELEALKIAHAVAQALQFAESQGLVHRDIKPENVLLSAEGTVKLADLGLVKDVLDGAGTAVTQSGVVLGTPHYMSPEQALGDRPLDVRSDIYSLGLCLWRLLTGLVPYDEERSASALQIINRHINLDLPDVRERASEVTPAAAELVARMAARDPDRRPASAAALAGELARLIRARSGRSDQGSLSAPGGPRPVSDRVRRAPPPLTTRSPPVAAKDDEERTPPGKVLGVAALALVPGLLLVAGLALAVGRRGGASALPATPAPSASPAQAVPPPPLVRPTPSPPPVVEPEPAAVATEIPTPPAPPRAPSPAPAPQTAPPLELEELRLHARDWIGLLQRDVAEAARMLPQLRLILSRPSRPEVSAEAGRFLELAQLGLLAAIEPRFDDARRHVQGALVERLDPSESRLFERFGPDEPRPGLARQGGREGGGKARKLLETLRGLGTSPVAADQLLCLLGRTALAGSWFHFQLRQQERGDFVERFLDEVRTRLEEPLSTDLATLQRAQELLDGEMFTVADPPLRGTASELTRIRTGLLGRFLAEDVVPLGEALDQALQSGSGAAGWLGAAARTKRAGARLPAILAARVREPLGSRLRGLGLARGDAPLPEGGIGLELAHADGSVQLRLTERLLEVRKPGARRVTRSLPADWQHLVIERRGGQVFLQVHAGSFEPVEVWSLPLADRPVVVVSLEAAGWHGSLGGVAGPFER